MESFTKELVSNASAQLFPDKTLSSFTNFFTRATESGRSMRGCNFRNILPNNVPKCHGEKKMFFDKKHSKPSEFYYLEPGLYPSITYSVETMNKLIPEWHNHTEIFITVKVSRRKQNVEIYLANEGSGLEFFGMDLGHILGSIVGNEFGVMLRRKGPHKSKFAYDNVRIHSLMIYTDLIEYNIVGDTKVPLLR